MDTVIARITRESLLRRMLPEPAHRRPVAIKNPLGAVEWISSEALADEVRRNPSAERRVEADTHLSLASSTIEVDEVVGHRVSTDDRLIKRAARGEGSPRIPVLNPVSLD